MSLLPRRWPLVLAAYALVGLTLWFVAWVIPEAGWFETPEARSDGGETFVATIVTVDELSRQSAEGRTVVEERVTAQSERDLVEVRRTYTEGEAGGFPLAPGDEVLVTAMESPAGTTYFIADRMRRTPLWMLAAGFGALVVLVGGWRGAWSIVGLAAGFFVIVRFIVPAILSGYDPVLISITGALVIMLTTLVLVHGFSRVAAVALAGTAVSLMLTGVLARISIDAAVLSGLAEESAGVLWVLLQGSIDPQGLLLAAIIIGALGVLDDVTATQASTVFELRAVDGTLGFRQLYRRGMNVGREHIAATVNTLVLAYAGAALPLLMILAMQPEPVPLLVNREMLATEVIRTLAGSIGIVAAVPITTLLAALVASRRRPRYPVRQRTHFPESTDPRLVELIERLEPRAPTGRR